jgi:hypothetical protein
MKWRDMVDLDESSFVCAVGGIEIEAACLASETPSLTENGLSFLADQRPVPFTSQVHSSQKPTFEGFCDVLVVIESLRNTRRDGLANRGCYQFQSVWTR